MTGPSKAPVFQNGKELDELFIEIRDYVNTLIDDALTHSVLLEDLISDNELVYSSIKTFVLGKGKRLRAVLFYLIYNAYSKEKKWYNANRAMIAIEFIHSFILIHDDVIDKSDIRRSKPTLHSSFDRIIQQEPMGNSNFISGRDLAIVAGDIMYAFAIHKFHEVSLEKEVFDKSLNILTKVAIQTAHGEFKELLEVLKPISDVEEEEIFKIYELKTARYTFSAPMLLGAIFAENEKDITILKDISLLLGRAFQIKNDLIELEEFAGNPMNIPPKDMKEKKRTIILLWTYENAQESDKKIIDDFLINDNPQINDYIRIYDIIKKVNILNKAKNLIKELKIKSDVLINSLNIDYNSKKALKFYFNSLV